MVREGEAPAEPWLHRQVGSAGEHPARQEPRAPENRKLLAVSKYALTVLAMVQCDSFSSGRGDQILDTERHGRITVWLAWVVALF